MFFFFLLHPLVHLTGPAQARKKQKLFFLQNNRSNNSTQVGRHAKDNLRFFELDSKTLFVCRRYFNKNYWERLSIKLFMTCNIKPLKLILAQIITQHGKKLSKIRFH